MDTSFYTKFISFYWRDAIEIMFFAILFYYVALWLRKDRQKNLLWYFYGYSICTCLAYYIQLPVLSMFFLLFSPVIIMLFITVHQETLQRNFVALKNIMPPRIVKKNWLEILLRSCLIAINNNKTVTCVVEQSDQLAEFLQTPFCINTEINDNLLNILIASEAYNENNLIWVNVYGNLIAINAEWHQHSTGKKTMHTWQDNALIYTTKTDALIIHINPTKRTFTIIIDGNLHENISAQHIYSFIQKHMVTPSLSKQTEKKGDVYGHIAKKDSEKQRTT